MNTRQAAIDSGAAGADGIPEYLSRHYWWAYLWPFSRPFFDHPAIISAILFGQYRLLRDATIDRLAAADTGRTLQLTCVYGDLTNRILDATEPEPLHITDVANLQLELARRKAPAEQLQATRMNVERLAYQDGSFDTIVIFFLLHEMPPVARSAVLRESLRCLAPGGRLLITEYAERPEGHFLYRNRWIRRLLERAEPFLASFWHESLTALVQRLADQLGRQVSETHSEAHFKGFYRILEYRQSGD